MEFYICKTCGNIIAYARSSGVPVMCCGAKMEQLAPNTTDAAQEKHVPSSRWRGIWSPSPWVRSSIP